jgi:hypothetical protein
MPGPGELKVQQPFAFTPDFDTELLTSTANILDCGVNLDSDNVSVVKRGRLCAIQQQ